MQADLSSVEDMVSELTLQVFILLYLTDGVSIFCHMVYYTYPMNNYI